MILSICRTGVKNIQSEVLKRLSLHRSASMSKLVNFSQLIVDYRQVLFANTTTTCLISHDP